MVRRNQSDPLVRLTIPGDLVSAKSPDSVAMRKAIDDTFRVALGRSDWKADIIITGTVEQWGVFAYLLMQRNLAVRLGQIKVEMFIPSDELTPHVFDATGDRPKVLNLPKMPVSR